MTLSKFLDPKNDVAFRKVFGSEEHKDIVIHFINDVLELKERNRIENVEFLSPIQDPEIAAKKQSIVDVLCKTQSGAQIVVEMQVAPTKGFEKRAQYYASKAYSRQLNGGKESRYHNLKEVIFIAIASCIIFPDKVEYKSDHVILDKKSYEHDLKDFHFTFIELPKFKKADISELTTMLERWCYFFKHAPEMSEADQKNIAGSDSIVEKACEVINMFNWTERDLIAYDEEITRIRDNEAAAEYRYDQYIAESFAEGLEKGEAKGRAEIAMNLLRQNMPLDTIASATGLSNEELM